MKCKQIEWVQGLKIGGGMSAIPQHQPYYGWMNDLTWVTQGIMHLETLHKAPLYTIFRGRCNISRSRAYGAGGR